VSDNNIEQLAYDISEKLNGDEIGTLLTFLKLVKHGMGLAMQPIADVRPQVLDSRLNPVAPKASMPSKAKPLAKATPAAKDDDPEDVF
jgi:hypothetical protein